MKKPQGSVLLGSVMMVAILTMVLVGIDAQKQAGSGLLQVVTAEHSWVQRDYANVASLNLVESGLEYALDDISKSWSKGINYSRTESLATGTYSVQTVAIPNDTSYTLESTGTVSMLDGVVTRKAQVTLINLGTNAPYTILANGNLNLKKGNVTINGNSSPVFHTNKNFMYDGAVAVYTKDALGNSVLGDISASGKIDGKGSLAVNTATADATALPLPTVDFDQLRASASSSVNGNYTVHGGSLGSSNAITYIDGNLTLQGNVTAQGTIVVDGNIDIVGTVKPSTGQTLEFISKGNVDFDDQGAVSAGPEIIASVYCEGNFKLRPGSPWIQGFIIATGNVEPTSANIGSVRMDYQTNVNSKLTTIKTSVSDWQEVCN